MTDTIFVTKENYPKIREAMDMIDSDNGTYELICVKGQEWWDKRFEFLGKYETLLSSSEMFLSSLPLCKDFNVDEYKDEYEIPCFENFVLGKAGWNEEWLKRLNDVNANRADIVLGWFFDRMPGDFKVLDDALEGVFHN